MVRVVVVVWLRMVVVGVTMMGVAMLVVAMLMVVPVNEVFSLVVDHVGLMAEVGGGPIVSMSSLL